MCRMLGFVATHPTQLGCALVDAPHSLRVQSREDLEGFAHADGWGIAQWTEDGLSVTRHLAPAHEGEDYRAFARTVRASRVIAHVRQATAGDVRMENTHPFGHGPWLFVHNGTIRHFDEGVGERMRAEMSNEHRDRIAGTTDSEVLFHLLLTRLERRPAEPARDVLAGLISDVAAWCADAGPCEGLGLNLLMSDGERMIGARWQQTLWMLERDGVLDCEACGVPHDQAGAPPGYRALLVASEPITEETWRPVPERTVFEIDEAPKGPRLVLQPCSAAA